ncbi:MAG: NADH-quinone oxidoreductase subunit NuoN [Gammaproteobacteria bacterium]|nr:NADH-quinone oxidoreductase subunit NuoN [Gammaproteobacteria bacterium]
MNFVMPTFLPALPEIFVLTMACAVLIADVYKSEKNPFITYHLSLVTLLGAAVLTVMMHDAEPVITFGGSFINDSMAALLKVFIYLVTAVVFLYSRDYLIQRGLFKGEFLILGLFAVLGMMVMVSAYNMVTVYLGLELMSLSLYAMVAMHRDSSVASEAAMKYFILGAVASGFLLYGMSLIYGATGQLGLTEIASYIKASSGHDLILVLGVSFVVVALAFKLGAVPFHMWIPDVYHGAPTPITLFIGSAPKIAALAMVLRLLSDGLGGLHGEWQGMLILLTVLSVTLGNVVAIAQKNIKRMLAYSTIAHVGFIFMGVLAGSPAGNAGAMFYIITYAIMALGGFGMILLLSRAGFEADNIEDFKGLAKRNPWFAFMMLIVMFSMAGVPPTVGFYAKLSVLSAVIDAGYVWVAAYAVLFSVVGAFYYLRVIKFMYFDDQDDNTPIESSPDVRAVMSANALAILLLGIFPGTLMGMCASAASVAH